MPYLESEGSFDVRIISATYKPDEYLKSQDAEKHEDAFVITLKLETSDGHHAFYDLNFNVREIQSGKFKGLTEIQASEKKLSEIGVPDGYLNFLQDAINTGLHARVTMKREEYQDKKTGETKYILKAKYLNALPKAVDITKIDLAEKIAKLKSMRPKSSSEPATPSAATKLPDSVSSEDDDKSLPF